MTLLIKIKTPVDYKKRKTSKYFILGLFIVLVASSSFILLQTSQNSVVDVATEVRSDVHTELQLLDPRKSLSASTE